MLLHLLHGNLPAPDGVALLAVRPQLPPVNVCVAVLAPLSNVGENRLDVTLDAGDRLVHAAQGITRLIVIEFRNCSYGLPPVRGVAVLTWSSEIAVRTVRTTISLTLRASRSCGKRQHQHSNQIEHTPRRRHGLAPCFGPTTLKSG